MQSGAMMMLLLAAVMAQTVPAAVAPPVPSAPVASPAAAVAKAGTALRLMVWDEVSTRSAKAGDRFLLVLDTAVSVDDQEVLPRGTKAWGEVVAARGSGMAGRAGKLETRLLHIQAGSREIRIAPASATDLKDKGQAGTLQVVLATAALTPWGPFARGNNARLKAGHIVEAVLGEDVAAP